MDLTLIVALLIAAMLFTIITIYCRSVEPNQSTSDLPQSLLASTFHEDGLPLTRQDVEKRWSDVDRWVCDICDFTNNSMKTTCVLCGTEKGVKLANHESSGDTKAHFSGLSIESRPLNSLNPRQKLARKRNEWIRIAAENGRWQWSRANDLKSRLSDQDRLSEEGLVTRLTASSLDGKGRLTLTNSRGVNAALSNRGYEITQDDLRTLEFIAALPFPQKYGWFIDQTTELMKPWEEGRLKMRINRENVLVESMEQILGIQMDHIHMPLRIEFIGESGIDAGGLEREWFSLLSEKLFDDSIGLFKLCCNNEKTYTINPCSIDASVDHLLYFRGTGRLIGRALLEGQHLQAHLCLPILKHILGTPITFRDLVYIDPEIYSSMSWIKENSNIQNLELDFSVMEKNLEKIRIIDLKPNGRNIFVTDENKTEYLELRFKYLVLTAFDKQLQSLMEGIFEVIPQELLMVFDFQELDLVLCGIPDIDIEDWKNNTAVIDLLQGSPVIDWFWEIVQDMTHEDRARLLQFTTGSSRVPIQGFKALTSYDGRICPFTLKGIPYSNSSYPKAHTCFNRIDLPIYQRKEELYQVMHLVINMDIMGFTDE